MTCNVFGGTLNFVQSNAQSIVGRLELVGPIWVGLRLINLYFNT